MIDQLIQFVQSRWYWLAAIVTGLSLEGTALFYQYVLDEAPCPLCIQSRAWVMLGIIVAIIALIAHKVTAIRYFSQLVLIASLAMLTNRSWITVQIERGLRESTCGMDAGFPAWLALDEWFPTLFEVWTMCGYTPDFLFGTTMGEALLFASVCLFGIATVALVLMTRPVKPRSAW